MTVNLLTLGLGLACLFAFFFTLTENVGRAVWATLMFCLAVVNITLAFRP